MPARTRFFKQALVAFLVVFFGFVVTRVLNDTDTPSYTLSNSIDLSSDGIATNSLLIGSQLPAIKLENVEGQEVSTQSLLNKPLIINVWYSTCEPCRRELPALANADTQYRDQVRFVGVNIKDSATVAKEFASQYGVEFELLLDKNGLFISQLGIATAPVTLAIDPQGLIVGQKAGEISASELDELVKELLK
ncbi:MAG: TlpA family protein disulfide reductase [Ilumatobacteraceae bacterium]|nr:TlpA family protein disulfide reductase [Ilumatobacteraceae bacterium]